MPGTRLQGTSRAFSSSFPRLLGRESPSLAWCGQAEEEEHIFKTYYYGNGNVCFSIPTVLLYPRAHLLLRAAQRPGKGLARSRCAMGI